MTDPEQYTMQQEELLQLSLLQLAHENAALKLQLARDQQKKFLQDLEAKYTENGKYELLGEVDSQTRVGHRRLAEVPAPEAVEDGS